MTVDHFQPISGFGWATIKDENFITHFNGEANDIVYSNVSYYFNEWLANL